MDLDMISTQITMFNEDKTFINNVSIQIKFDDKILDIDKKIFEIFDIHDLEHRRVFKIKYFYKGQLLEKSKRIYNVFHMFQNSYLVKAIVALDAIISTKSGNDTKIDLEHKFRSDKESKDIIDIQQSEVINREYDHNYNENNIDKEKLDNKNSQTENLPIIDFILDMIKSNLEQKNTFLFVKNIYKGHVIVPGNDTRSKLFISLVTFFYEYQCRVYRRQSIKHMEIMNQLSYEDSDAKLAILNNNACELYNLDDTKLAKSKILLAINETNELADTSTEINAALLKNKGLIYYRENDYIEALKLFKECANLLIKNRAITSDLKRKLADIYYLLALSLYKSDRFEEALKLIDKALYFIENDETAPISLFNSLAELSYQTNIKLKRRQQAYECLNKQVSKLLALDKNIAFQTKNIPLILNYISITLQHSNSYTKDLITLIDTAISVLEGRFRKLSILKYKFSIMFIIVSKYLLQFYFHKFMVQYENAEFDKANQIIAKIKLVFAQQVAMPDELLLLKFDYTVLKSYLLSVTDPKKVKNKLEKAIELSKVSYGSNSEYTIRLLENYQKLLDTL